jgi:tRNA dimethylallyltransferase
MNSGRSAQLTARRAGHHPVCTVASPHPIVLIVGPTAGGKTGLAIELAKRLPGGGEVISADSMQIYRGMDIGTAKPAAAERAGVPHHLLDMADPASGARDHPFTVDTWLELAQRAVADIRRRRRWPIIVGGTNLYVQALLYGLLDGPAPDPDLRTRLEGMSQAELRAWLERIDRAAAQRIHANDRKRTIRAIEVHERSGRTISEMQTQWAAPAPRSDVIVIGLDWPVDVINRRINARVEAMIDAGLVEEVRRVSEAGLGRQAREALGYKQIIDHVEGRCSLEEAIEEIKIRTRRYAKQQRSWLRRFRALPNSLWLDAADRPICELADHAARFCKTSGSRQ